MIRKHAPPSTPRVAEPETWPHEVKVGSVRLRIYKGSTGGKSLFVLVYYNAGKRVRKGFRDFGDAKREAEMAARKLAEGQIRVLELRDEDRSIYLAARETLKKTGKRLDMVAGEYTEALAALKGTGTLMEAARFFAKHHGKVIQKTVSEIVAELLEGLEADGASELYKGDVRKRLGRFAASFRGYIANITAAEIDEWLRGLGVGPRTRNNFRNLIVTLFRFAKERHYLSEDRRTEAEATRRAKEVERAVSVLQPEEMEKLLEAANLTTRHFLAIAGFAGVRHWELLRLEWADVKLAEGHIEIKAAKAKTASRRIIPMSANLAAWLAPHRDMSGPICPTMRMTERVLRLAESVGIEWRHNVLRHSFGSYRLALVKNAAQVSLEMGNTPRKLFEHYREVVTEKQAQRWFAIMPQQAANIILLKKAGAA